MDDRTKLVAFDGVAFGVRDLAAPRAAPSGAPPDLGLGAGATRQATRWSQPASASGSWIEPRPADSSRKVTWNASSARCSSEQ